VNIADSRWNAKGSCYNPGGGPESWQSRNEDKDKYPLQRGNKGDNPDIPVKSMVGIPERFMLEMIRRGWILRNKIIWRKSNPMPSSAGDRFTDDYEFLYFFTLSKKYFFEMQYEPMIRPEATFNPDTSNHSTLDLLNEGNRTTTGLHDGRTQYGSPALGRHLRSVWDIPTKGIKGMKHHAVFPAALCTTPILASCPEFVCTKCGKPRVKIYKKVSHYEKREEAHAPNNEPTKVDSTGWERPDIELLGLSDCGCDHTGKTESGYDEGMNANRLAKLRQYAREHGEEYHNPLELVGLSDCECANDFRPGVVLDIFGGSGTVALEARRLAREAWVIDISREYAEEAVERVTKLENPLDR
jgi:DNA modification methylase